MRIVPATALRRLTTRRARDVDGVAISVQNGRRQELEKKTLHAPAAR
jgi:hypothetical protein